MVADLSELMADDHTSEWEFYSLMKDMNPGGQCQIKCKCGIMIGVLWTNIDHQSRLWNKFMIHKFGPQWSEAPQFDRVWNECFPQVKPSLFAGMNNQLVKMWNWSFDTQYRLPIIIVLILVMTLALMGLI